MVVDGHYFSPIPVSSGVPQVNIFFKTGAHRRMCALGFLKLDMYVCIRMHVCNCACVCVCVCVCACMPTSETIMICTSIAVASQSQFNLLICTYNIHTDCQVPVKYFTCLSTLHTSGHIHHIYWLTSLYFDRSIKVAGFRKGILPVTPF